MSLLGSLEHSFHHTLLLEIRALSDRYPLLLGGCGKDSYRMSNSFTAMARLLGKRLEESTALHNRIDNESQYSPHSTAPGTGQRLQVKVQEFGEKLREEAGEEEEEGTPAFQRRYSLSQSVRDEWREMRFNRSKSLALHVVRSRSINSETGEDGTDLELNPDNIISNPLCNQDSGQQEALRIERNSSGDGPLSLDQTVKDIDKAENDQSEQKDALKEEEQEEDRLFTHLRDNMEAIREFCKDIMKEIPFPEECIMEDTNRGCVAKLSFSCPLKGHYCLYAKSCFNLMSWQPHLWIRIMLLHLQNTSSVPLRSKNQCVQRLATLWEKTQLKGAHSFTLAMTQHTTLHRKDLDSLQAQLEEVRFFDLFGFSEEHGGWLCFMCNNPEKATVVNQEGQPLIEGKLKEKQIRFKFIKRWKTRYFTLAGNQLLFRKGGKSKDEMDDIPIELSKVQSVKVVARKRRDRGLPRAFEIFTDSKTYVLKAKDEKHAEEWLQCINVAVAQARERENREATTYL